MKQVQRLRREHKPEVVEVLAAAFHDYPVMRFVLQSDGDEYVTQLKALVEFYTEARLAKERPVIGVHNSDVLVAASLIDEASLKPWAEMESEVTRLKQTIGTEAFRRLELYETISCQFEPKEPHHFIGMIGVRPEFHGKGYARPMLDAVKGMALSDPDSTGVCLSTEDPENVPFYQHFDYKIIGEVNIDRLHSWCLFLAL